MGLVSWRNGMLLVFENGLELELRVRTSELSDVAIASEDGESWVRFGRDTKKRGIVSDQVAELMYMTAVAQNIDELQEQVNAMEMADE